MKQLKVIKKFEETCSVKGQKEIWEINKLFHDIAAVRYYRAFNINIRTLS